MFSGLTKIFGDSIARKLKPYFPIVSVVNALEAKFSVLSDNELRLKTDEFKARLGKGETLEALLPEVFALVREASKRTLGQRHFDVQLVGGIALHNRSIAEIDR